MWLEMSSLDVEIKIELKIYNLHTESTLVQVDVPYLNKTIEVNVPNNIQEGHKIRFKGLGCIDKSGDKKGDLYIVVSKIIYAIDGKETSMQKMLVVENNNFSSVNNYLESGWKIKDFKPFRQESFLYVYVLLEK